MDDQFNWNSKNSIIGIRIYLKKEEEGHITHFVDFVQIVRFP